MVGQARLEEVAGAPPRPDVMRRWVPPIALAIGVVAAVTDPAGWVRLVVLGVAVSTLVLWARWPGLPLTLLTVGVLAPVVFAQLSGQLEPSLFLVVLLALVVARGENSRRRAGAVCAAALISPIVIVALQPAGNRIAWGIWLVGLAFSVVVGRGMKRQERLVVELSAARQQLAAQAHAEERRRIARDIHDLVGHGLSGVLLQVASARHVLRRNVDAADEALAAAEVAGRSSMRELRGTMTLLRGADEGAAALPLPDFAELGALVDSARRDGLAVEYRSVGDLDGIAPATGLALYRIAQEALHNATRHAPHASTVVTVVATGGSVELVVDSVGALAALSDGGRPRYGLVGMRERAATVGGELQAGPTPEGWRVRCRVPLGSA